MPVEHDFVQPRSVAIRLWHWLDALAISGLLATVLLRKTFLSWRTNSALIESKVAELGGSISTEGAVTIAKALRAPMWDWHYTLGFLLVGLLVARVGLALARPDHAPLRKLASALVAYRSGPARPSAHYLAVKASYVLFYVALVFMATSGLTLYYGDDMGLGKELLGSVKGSHELAMWFFAGFVGLHVVGVIVAELRGHRGLVSDMIHGGDR